jgi:imidazolonepropionase-like amidohydrolase
VTGDPAPVTAVRAGRLFDGVSDLGRGTVIIVDGRIVDVDRSGAAPPSSATIVDLGADACVLPGLIDPHTHLVLSDLEDPVRVVGATDQELLACARAAATRALAAGVTTVRDLGDRGYLTTILREELRGAPWTGPEILCAGPPITTPGGHCWFLGGAEHPTTVVAAVRQRVARGCDVVKVMASGGHRTPGSDAGASQFGLAQLRTVVEEAHRLGRPVAAHAHGTRAILDALAAGVDTIEHATFLSPEGHDPGAHVLDAVASGASVIAVTSGCLPGGPRPDPAVARRLAVARRSWARLHQAGARLVVGTDAGVARGKPHDVLPYGLMAMATLGMTTGEVLRSATAGAASACGLVGRKGRLVRGADADLLAVQGNPLRDLGVLTDVRAVFRAGRRVR